MQSCKPRASHSRGTKLRSPEPVNAATLGAMSYLQTPAGGYKRVEGSNDQYDTDEWILIADTRDGGYLDGFTALRTKDITKVKKVDGFEPELLKKLKQWPPAAPEQPISLSSAEAIIRTVGEGRDALTIHQEKDKPDACFIGAPVDWGRKSVWLLEIDRHARWDTEMTKYRLKDITRIDFGGGYEDALLTVSGAKPDRRSGGHEGK